MRELVARTAEYVDSMGLVPVDGRAARHPDARSIRYYVGLGLVDCPLGYRGNAALYGRRHLLQLLAIKALQMQGAGLPDIQRSLLGKTDEWLAAQLPPVRHVPKGPGRPVLPEAPGARWTLELDLAPGVQIRVEAGALAHLDPDRLTAAFRGAIEALGLSQTTVPPEEDA